MEQDNINDILGIESSQSHRIDTRNTNNTNRYRYPALMTIAGIYMVLAWIVGIAAIISIFYFLNVPNMQIFGLIPLVIGGLLSLGLAAISELIKVFLDIEDNTRKSANN